MEPIKALICHIEKEISSESSQTIPLKLFQITLQPFQLGCFKKTGMIEELLIEFVVTQMSTALHRFDRHNWELLCEIVFRALIGLGGSRRGT